MNDHLPDDLHCWHRLEEVARDVFAQFGYREMRLPLVEKTELFARSIGQSTDIVEKEMYTFQDRNGDSLTLRPEGTAGVVRAVLEHGLVHNTTQRLWYAGPMFRHERPQKGRYRQFHQIGLEAFGMAEAELDAEVIALTALLWQRIGIDNLRLEINSLGTSTSRELYRDDLVRFYQGHRDRLDEDSQRRLVSNPLRILDSKDPGVAELNRDAPDILDYLDAESRKHLDRLLQLLDVMGIDYHLNPRLVRGLDYYSRTVFEWTTDLLGAQSAICGGGRYDGLVEQLGGRPVPAAGFGIGVERLIEVMTIQARCGTPARPDVYIVQLGDAATLQGMQLAMRLRARGIRTVTNIGGGGFKGQFKRADRSGARLALILGDDEVSSGTVTVKDLATGRQETLPLTDIHAEIGERLSTAATPES